MLKIIKLALTIAVFACAGCAGEQEQTIEHRYNVLSKQQRGNAYLLEISNQDTHEYVEVTKNGWDRTSIGDTVTLNEQGELVAVNNVPVNGD